MLKWFRPGPSPQQTPLAMIGASTGDRVLVAGSPDPALAAELGRATGLSGETVVAGPSSLRDAVEQAARNHGALVEWLDHPAPAAPLPVPTGHVRIAVLAFDLAGSDPAAARPLVAEAARTLEPGGRIVIIDGRRRTGFFAARTSPTVEPGPVVSVLVESGLVAARLLGQADGVAYYEGRKPRVAAPAP